MTKDRTMTIAVAVPLGKAIFCDACDAILYFDPNNDKNKEIINNSIEKYSLDKGIKDDYISKDRYIIGLQTKGLPLTYHDCCCNTECMSVMFSRLKREVAMDSKNIFNNKKCHHTITMEFMPGDDKNPSDDKDYEEG